MSDIVYDGIKNIDPRYSDIERIRQALADHPDKIIDYACWCKDDAEELRSLLTEKQRQRVKFRWLVFPERKAGEG